MLSLFYARRSRLLAATLLALVVALCWKAAPGRAQPQPADEPKAADQSPAAKAGDLDRRLRRMERAIERLGGKLDDNLDPNIVQVAPEARIDFGPPSTTTPVGITPFQPAIQIIDFVDPAAAESQLKELKKKRVELLEKLLETSDEIRATETKIVEARNRLFGASGQ